MNGSQFLFRFFVIFLCQPIVSVPLNFARLFRVMKNNSSVLFFKVRRVFRLLSARIKFHQIFVIFETTISFSNFTSFFSVSWDITLLYFFSLLLWYKSCKFQLKKCYLLWVIQTCGFKHDMMNFVSFYPITQKFENFPSMGLFCPNIWGLS